MVSAIIMETNLDEIIDLVDWAEAEGLDGVNITALQVTSGSANLDPKWFENSLLWVWNLEKLDRVMDELIRRSGLKSPVRNTAKYLRGIREYYHAPVAPKPADFTCHVGHNSFWIDPSGFVSMC